MIWIIGFFLSGDMLEKIYYSLSLQLDSMRIDRFESWYKEKLKIIWGDFVVKDGRIDIIKSFQKELRLNILLIVLFIFVWIMFIIASGSYKEPLIIFFKRIIDYFPPIFTGTICFKITIGIVIFVGEYTRCSLKPMLTTLNHEGLRSLGKLFTISLSSELSGIVIYWTITANAHTGPLFINVLICLICLIGVSAFSIGMPYMIYTAAKEAKRKATTQYAEHIEDAFKKFLNDPNEQTYEKFMWLKTHENVIKKIPSWPLTKQQTIVVVLGGNLLLYFVSIRFILLQIGR